MNEIGPGLPVEKREPMLNALVLLSRLFWGPEPELCRDLTGAQPAGELRAMAAFSPDAAAAARLMTGYLANFSNAGDLCEELETAYVRLFVSAPGGPLAPPYHSHYDSPDGQLMGRPAQMMKDRLTAAGLSLNGRPSEPPDHAAVEIEYLFHLLESAWTADDAALAGEASAFVVNEMQPWMRRWAERLQTETACPLYPAAARLLLALLDELG